MTTKTKVPDATPTPWIELILIICLPLAVLFAGAYTTVLAVQEGFTPHTVSISMPGH